jgi:hypothetical protein
MGASLGEHSMEEALVLADKVDVIFSLRWPSLTRDARALCADVLSSSQRERGGPHPG